MGCNARGGWVGDICVRQAGGFGIRCPSEYCMNWVVGASQGEWVLHEV